MEIHMNGLNTVGQIHFLRISNTTKLEWIKPLLHQRLVIYNLQCLRSLSFETYGYNPDHLLMEEIF